MEYSKLLDLASDLGYALAMSGAETFRVEESITRILAAYDIKAEVFVIPNCMHISIEPVAGRPLTRMCRIGNHGNDLDAVEKFSGLSRRICSERPAPEIAAQWLRETQASRRTYSLPIHLLGDYLGAFGFAILFGGNLWDAFFSGICGVLVGMILKFMENFGSNQFFTTIAASFPMAFLAYGFGVLGLSPHPDAAIIGALMILVPGLLFTNGMRDIIFGDTNSGINRIVQVFLIGVALVLGTAAAWNLSSILWGKPVSLPMLEHTLLVQCLCCLVSGIGFSILFNIHGPGGLLCVLGAILTWITYALYVQHGGNVVAACFWGSIVAGAYSESMARIRKYPAISYLVVSVFPLIPGAGVYYTMNYAMQGQMDLFASKGMETAAIAGLMAVGILLVSTSVRMWTVWKQRRKK